MSENSQNTISRMVLANLIGVTAMTILIFIVNVHLYELTSSVAYLGFYGAAIFSGRIVALFPAGILSDKINRGKIASLSSIFTAFLVVGMIFFHDSANALLLGMFLISASRSFWVTALRSLIAEVSQKDNVQKNSSWFFAGHNTGNILGPILAGVLLDFTHNIPYCLAFSSVLLIVVGIIIKWGKSTKSIVIDDNLAGIRFVWNNPVLLSAFFLDLVAVLFGGCVALLPAYAKNILHISPSLLGLLQAAIPIGAVFCSLTILDRFQFKYFGKGIILGAAGFGICNFIFGISENFWLSFTALFLAGAFDNISTVLREALTARATPMHLLGRVSAVKSLFVNASNELGRLESGLAAHFLGITLAVTSGAAITVLACIGVFYKSKEFKNYKET